MTQSYQHWCARCGRVFRDFDGTIYDTWYCNSCLEAMIREKEASE